MKLFLLSIIFVCFTVSLAQDISLANIEQFNKFKSSETYFVKSDIPFSLFNDYMIEDLEKVWKITPYKIISSLEFSNLSKNKNSSFIFLSEVQKTQGKNVVIWDLLNIVLGSNSGVEKMNTMPDLGSAPLAYSQKNDEAQEEYLYKLAGILRFFQYYINFNIQNPNSDLKNIVKTNKFSIKEKDLWLIKQDMAAEVDNVDKIKKYYSGIVKFVNKDEIRKAIHEGNDKVVFLHKVGHEKAEGKWCLKFLISAENGCPYYYEISTIKTKGQDGFSSADFKKINK